MYLSDLRRKKRGLSVIVGYALLIGMTIALSVLVFQWLRHYVGEANGEDLSCPEGVSLTISEAECVGGLGGFLNLTLKNRGKHNVDGFVVRVNDRLGSEQGFYTFDSLGENVSVGASVTKDYLLSISGLDSLNLVEIQSYRMVGEKKIHCPFIDIVELECTI
jgi:hypothetical protein